MGYKQRGLYPAVGGGGEGGGLITGIDCKSALNKVVLIKTRFAFTGFH